MSYVTTRRSKSQLTDHMILDLKTRFIGSLFYRLVARYMQVTGQLMAYNREYWNGIPETFGYWPKQMAQTK